MTAWFNGLSGTAKTVTALCTAAATIFALAIALGGWFGLPAQVEVNVSAITENRVEIHDTREQSVRVETKLDAMICLQLLDDGADPAGCL